MITLIENGNFTPAVRTSLLFTGMYFVLIGHEFNLPFFVSQFGFFLKFNAYFSYRAVWRNLRPFDTTFKKNFATYTDKQKYEEDAPLWASIFAGCVKLYCLPDAYRRGAKVNTEKRRKEKANALMLQATAITMDGLMVVADIKQTGESFSFNVSTQNADVKEDGKSEIYHFSSIKALSEFLESKTILRIGDFKSSPR